MKFKQDTSRARVGAASVLLLKTSTSCVLPQSSYVHTKAVNVSCN